MSPRYCCSVVYSLEENSETMWHWYYVFYIFIHVVWRLDHSMLSHFSFLIFNDLGNFEALKIRNYKLDKGVAPSESYRFV